eukprot:scaffold220738_cov38-Prasinocladus_malaysianus.AAC.2
MHISEREASVTMTALRALVMLGLLAAASAKGPFIGTDKNFDSAVLGSGKNVFVKFLALAARAA